MAVVQIPNLPAVANLSGAELVEAVQAGSSVKVSLNQLNALFRIGPVSFPLAVDIGGTGTTTSTGTGSVVLSDNPTLNNPTLVGPSFNIGSFGLGTVGAPSITFTGDLNTGIWSPGADIVAVSTGGLERMRIDSAGDVGIGTNTVAPVFGRTLQIGNGSTLASVSLLGTGAATTGDIFLTSGASTAGLYSRAATDLIMGSGDVERMRVNTAGNVGIGTTNPLERLHVNTASGAAGIRISVSDVSYGNLFSSASGTTLNNITAAPLMFGTTNIERMRVHSNGGVSINNIVDPGAGNLSVTGNILIPAATTETRAIEIGAGRAGNGTSFIDLIGDATYTDYGARLARGATGANTDTTLYHRGTGALQLFAQDAGIVALYTTAAERYRVGPLGQLGIGGANFGTTGQTIISGGSGASTAWGTLGLAGGGTGVTTAPAAAAVLMGYTTTATSGGTTILDNTSSQYQLFTGVSTHNITLPVASTLTTGWTFHIVNNSTGNLTIRSSGANFVATAIPGTTVMVTCILASGTTAASWEFGYTDFGSLTGTGSAVMSTSPTLVTPNLGTGSFDLGAVTTPSITFAGDANTGLWSPAADTIAVSTNGAERMRISDAGVITQLNATSGAGAIVGEQTFRLSADGVAFGPTIGDFFGPTSSVSLEASSVYEVTIYAVFTKTTAGTATFTLTASSAPTRMVGTYQASPITGIAAGVDTSGFAGSQGATTAAFAATGSLTTGVNHAYQFAVQLQTNAAANFRLQLTQSLGSATPLAGSYYTVKKISATIGTFVA